MAYLMPIHKGVLFHGSLVAERIIARETQAKVNDLYDIKTTSEMDGIEPAEDVFAQLVRIETGQPNVVPRYSICLQDPVILDFIRKNPDIDFLAFITFILTHELLHVHRFSTGKADFFGASQDEEAFVDSLTRIFFIKHPVFGLNKAITLLDKLRPAPLYDKCILDDSGRSIHAYL